MTGINYVPFLPITYFALMGLYLVTILEKTKKKNSFYCLILVCLKPFDVSLLDYYPNLLIENYSLRFFF